MELTAPYATSQPQPFLRWAGGKRWLVPKLIELVGGLDYGAYHEPFLGGGSAFLGLASDTSSFLSDANPELIEAYIQIRDDPVGVARELRRHKNNEDYYYLLRQRSPRLARTRAARFIFLNHTSFNGIYRVNLQGRYNVPYGHRERPVIPTEGDLVAVSKRLMHSELAATDFEDCIGNVKAGDLVFLDPPYTVAHNDNGFVKYNQQLFSWEDQSRLRDLVQEIKMKDAYYVLTNAAHPSISALFSCGDRLIETRRRNSIGGREASRGSATEYLFTNIGDA